MKQLSQIDRFIELQSYRYIKQTIQSPHFEFIKALDILFGWRVLCLWSNIQLFLREPLCIAYKFAIGGIVSLKQVILLERYFIYLFILLIHWDKATLFIVLVIAYPAVCSHLNLSIFL